MKKSAVLFCMGVLVVASPAALAGPQQEKMKFCSKEAKGKGLKGSERKAFMKECLGGKGEAAPGKKTGAAAGNK